MNDRLASEVRNVDPDLPRSGDHPLPGELEARIPKIEARLARIAEFQTVTLQDAAAQGQLVLRDVLNMGVSWHLAGGKSLSHVVRSAFDGYAWGSLRALERTLDDIERTVAQSAPEVLDARETRSRIRAAVTTMKDQLITIRSHYGEPLELMLDGRGALNEAIDRLRAEASVQTLQSLTESVQASIREAEPLLQQLKSELSKKVSLDTTLAFVNRADSHRDFELVWTVVASLAGLLAALALFNAVQGEIPKDATNAFVAGYLFHRVIVLIGASALLRFALKRWNLERNLRIIYSHRVAAINQYSKFDALIDDSQTGAKDALRLSVAALLLSDPVTGYRDDRSSDVNFNPVLNLAEGLTGKVKGA